METNWITWWALMIFALLIAQEKFSGVRGVAGLRIDKIQALPNGTKVVVGWTMEVKGSRFRNAWWLLKGALTLIMTGEVSLVMNCKGVKDE